MEQSIYEAKSILMCTLTIPQWVALATLIGWDLNLLDDSRSKSDLLEYIIHNS